MSSCKPAAVGIVTSGSTGKRLVFYHKGLESPPSEAALTMKDVASVLPPTTLAEILAPSSLMINRKFELSVDEWKFVGHPFSVQNGSFSISFNVVFVLESYCPKQVVTAYDHLSYLIGSAIVHEEKKCGFLCQQVKLLMQLLEQADIPDPSAENLQKESSLAKSLCSVLYCLQSGQNHVQIKINNWSEVNTLLNFEWSMTQRKESENKQSCAVRSYSALLLFESADDIIQCLSPYSNPAMQRLLTVVTPLKNLQTVSLDADIPLDMVLHLASHLVHWGKAMAIYPLSENNMYITSPTADTRVESQLSVRFCDKFPNQCLADVLSNFSLPISLRDIKDIIADERVVIWLLQHKQIVQLHTYVYIVPIESHHDNEDINRLKEGTTINQSEGEMEGIESPAVLQLLQHLTPQERKSVLRTSAAKDPEDLEHFARLSRYFHGNHHLEGIMLMENVPRSELLTLIDKFSEVLVTSTLVEHTTASIV